MTEQREYRDADPARAEEDYRREQEKLKRRRAESSAKGWKTRRENAKRRRRSGKRLHIHPIKFFVPIRVKLVSYPAAWRWSVAYLLSTIHLHWVRRWKWRLERGDEGWCNLKMAYLRRIIPRKILKPLIERLIEENVIECDGIAIQGEKALGYRLMPENKDTHVVTCTEPAMMEKIAKVYSQDREHWQKVHHGLRRWLDQVRIDVERCEAIVRAINKVPKKRRKEEYNLERYHSDLLGPVYAIHHGAHYLTVSPYGRVTTTVCQLKRELMSSLTLNKEPLVWIDASCCQPLLGGMMAHIYWTGDRSTRARMRERVYSREDPYRSMETTISKRDNSTRTSPTTQATTTSSTTITTTQTETETETETGTGTRTHVLYRGKGHLSSDFERSCESRTSQQTQSSRWKDSLTRFITTCEEGRIYDDMMTDEEKQKGTRYRQRFKVRFLAMLYAKTNVRWPNSLRHRFENRYPAPAQFFAEMRKKDHRRAPRLMQCVESTLFIHRICGRILRECRQVPILTKHDAIATTPRHAGYVCRVIQEEFGRLGLDPTLKVTTTAHLSSRVRGEITALGPQIHLTERASSP